MAKSIRRDKAWLFATATAIAKMLKEQSQGASIRTRLPGRATDSNTAGWRAVIGDLGKGQPRMEIWYDKFTGHPDRKLYACLYSAKREPINKIVAKATKELWPVRQITPQDTINEEYLCLISPLKRSEFKGAIQENYEQGRTFFGIYDPTIETATRINTHFCERAVAFFEDVASTLPSAQAEEAHRDVYPQHENRQQVVSHVRRERSRLLATERKIQDHYQCQVCVLRFEDVYGQELGAGFAEAHHVIPLSHIESTVKTRLEDLITVCANCHRMLHRMDGKRGDIKKLKAMVQQNRKKKR